MFQNLFAVFFLLFIINDSVLGETIVVDLLKQNPVGQLTPQQFHSFNLYHLLFNFGAKVEKTDFAEKQKSFHDLNYVGKVSIGDPAQTISVIYEIAISDIMVLSAEHCPFIRRIYESFCHAHTGFNVFKPKRRPDTPDYMSSRPDFSMYARKSKLDGKLYFEDVKIGKLVLKDTHLAVIEHWEGNFPYGKCDGVVGVGRISDTNFKHASVVTSLDKANAEKGRSQPSFTGRLKTEGFTKIAFHLYKDKKGNDVGQIVLGAEEDTARFKGPLDWVPSIGKKDMYYWRPNVYSIKVVAKSDGLVVTVNNQNNIAFFDPGTSLIAGPTSMMDQINKMIFRGIEARMRPNKFNGVEFDCVYRDQLSTVVVVINKKGYILRPEDYVIQLKTTCTSGFMGVDKLQAVILGDPFLRKFFVVFDNANEQMGIAEALPPKKRGMWG